MRPNRRLRPLTSGTSLLGVGLVLLAGACSSSPDLAAGPDAEVLAKAVTAQPEPAVVATPAPATPAPATPAPTATPEPPEAVSINIEGLERTGESVHLASIAAPNRFGGMWVIGGTVFDLADDTALPAVWSSPTLADESWERTDLPVGDESTGHLTEVVATAGGHLAIGAIGEDGDMALWAEVAGTWELTGPPESIDGQNTWFTQIETDGADRVVVHGGWGLEDGRGRSVLWALVDGEWEVALKPADGYADVGIHKLSWANEFFFVSGWLKTADHEYFAAIWSSPDGREWTEYRLPYGDEGDETAPAAVDVAHFNSTYQVIGRQVIDGRREPIRWWSGNGTKWNQGSLRLRTVLGGQDDAGGYRVVGGGAAFAEIVATADGLFATVDHSFLASVFTSKNGLRWDILPVPLERERDDTLDALTAFGGRLVVLHDGSRVQEFSEQWKVFVPAEATASPLAAVNRLTFDRASGTVAAGGGLANNDQWSPRIWHVGVDGVLSGQEWDVIDVAAAGSIVDLQVGSGGWVAVGSGSEGGNNPQAKVWIRDSSGQPWAESQFPVDALQGLGVGLSSIDGTTIAAGVETNLVDWWDIVDQPVLYDTSSGSSVTVETGVPVSKMRRARCPLDDSAVFFVEGELDPVEPDGDDAEQHGGEEPAPRFWYRSLVARSGPTYELGAPIESERGTPRIWDCLADDGDLLAVGTIVAGDVAHRAMWRSSDGLVWSEVDLGAGVPPQSRFGRVVGTSRGKVLLGYDPGDRSGSPGAGWATGDPGAANLGAGPGHQGTIMWLWPDGTDPGSAVAVYNPIGVESPAEVRIDGAIQIDPIQGEHLLMEGQESGINRIWAVSVDDLFDYAELVVG